MTEDERYLFDLNGYLILSGVLSSDEVQRCNESLDHHSEKLLENSAHLPAGDEGHRIEVKSMLAWERPWCEPFRNLLVHPNVTPYLESILSEGYRFDHGPWLIAMNKGAPDSRCVFAGPGHGRT